MAKQGSDEPVFNFNLERTTEELQKMALDALFSSLPHPVQKRVRALKTIQDQHDELYKEYQKERLELENKWATKYTPLYEKRKEIIAGNAEISETDISDKHRPKVEEIEEKDEAETKTETKEEGIPNFWLTAMKNNFEIATLISGDRDEEALAFLTDIRSVNSPDNLLNFTLEFYFRPNPFFENEKLTKTYNLTEEGIDDISVDSCDGCTVNWKANHDLTVKKVKRKQKKKKGGQTRVIEVSEPTPTFFNFFKSLKIPEDEEMEEEVLEELEEQLLMEYEIGTIFQKKLITQAVLWFTGEAVPEDEGFDDDLDDDEEGGDFDEEDDEDDEEEAYFVPPSRGRGGRGRGGRGGAPPQLARSPPSSLAKSPPSSAAKSPPAGRGAAAAGGARGGRGGANNNRGRGRGGAGGGPAGSGTTLGGPPAENPECKQQ